MALAKAEDCRADRRRSTAARRPVCGRWACIEASALPRALGLALGALACAALLGPATSAAAGPTATRLVYAPGKIVPIPASIPHEAGDMVDRRILPDLRWIAQRYPIYVTDGYSGPLPNGEHVGCDECHVRDSDHYNGLAVDLVPLGPEPRCDATGRRSPASPSGPSRSRTTRSRPSAGSATTATPATAAATTSTSPGTTPPAPQFQLAEWVEVFPVGAAEARPKPRQASRSRRRRRRPRPAPPAASPRSADRRRLDPRGFGD